MSNINAASAGEDDGSIIGIKATPIPRGLEDLDSIWDKIQAQIKDEIIIIKGEVYHVWVPALRQGVMERLE